MLVQRAPGLRFDRDLEETNEFLQSLVAVAAHEIASPLTAILGFSETILRTPETLSPTAQSSLEVINRQAHRLARLVTELLTTSKINVNALVPKTQTVALKSLISEALDDFRLDSEATTVDCPDHIHLWADPDHVLQVLVNYVGNAFKYGVPPVTIETRKGRSDIEIRVRDAGAGVRTDFVPRLFQRFARAGGSGAPGVDLGLFIVRGLAIANGGDAWYEQQTTGACFAAKFPASPPT